MLRVGHLPARSIHRSARSLCCKPAGEKRPPRKCSDSGPRLTAIPPYPARYGLWSAVFSPHPSTTAVNVAFRFAVFVSRQSFRARTGWLKLSCEIRAKRTCRLKTPQGSASCTSVSYHEGSPGKQVSVRSMRFPRVDINRPFFSFLAENSQIAAFCFAFRGYFSASAKYRNFSFPKSQEKSHLRRTSGRRTVRAVCAVSPLYRTDQGCPQGHSQALVGRRKRRAPRELCSSSRQRTACCESHLSTLVVGWLGGPFAPKAPSRWLPMSNAAIMRLWLKHQQCQGRFQFSRHATFHRG